MLLYRTASVWWVQTAPGIGAPLPRNRTDSLTRREDLFEYLETLAHGRSPEPLPHELLAPIQAQEVWAAGVSYYRSRAARVAESEAAGGGDFYDRVYSAPGIVLQSHAAPRGGAGSRRSDLARFKWNVPEPELALLISPRAKILGYTATNDMSSRDIEGANPLYPLHAKIYDGCCALGPGILVSGEQIPADTGVHLNVRRAGEVVFHCSIKLAEIKRSLEELVAFLFRESSFPNGCFLLTGTGTVPPDSFTLGEGGPTPNFGGALGDAAFMTGLERNSDLVVMAAYAPLFVNVEPGAMQGAPI